MHWGGCGAKHMCDCCGGGAIFTHASRLLPVVKDDDGKVASKHVHNSKKHLYMNEKDVHDSKHVYVYSLDCVYLTAGEQQGIRL